MRNRVAGKLVLPVRQGRDFRPGYVIRIRMIRRGCRLKRSLPHFSVCLVDDLVGLRSAFGTVSLVIRLAGLSVVLLCPFAVEKFDR